MEYDLLKDEYLVSYDYGQGALWAVVKASSPILIEKKFPKLRVYDKPPAWMSATQVVEIRKGGVIHIDGDNIPEWMWLTNSG